MVLYAHFSGVLSSSPSATVWESDDYLSDGGDFIDEHTIKASKNTLKTKKLPIIPARKVGLHTALSVQRSEGSNTVLRFKLLSFRNVQ